MDRPRRRAAQRALELLSSGVTTSDVDSRHIVCLPPDEEDELDDQLLEPDYVVERRGIISRYRNLRGASTSQSYFSYGDMDTVPIPPTFNPAREVGPHLPSVGARGDATYTRAIDFFNLFFNDEMIEVLCDNTNTYAMMHILEKPTYSRSDGAWETVSPPEMRALIALLIWMGFFCLPDISRYWATVSLYSGGWARRFMSRNRFKALMAFLHVSDPGLDDPKDKLSKLQPLLGHVKGVCKSLLQPRTAISIDERMVKSKARSGIRQYMPLKPVRFGYKIWCLCESGTGYTLDFNVYTGKRERPGKNGLAYDVVMSLMENYMEQGYMLYFDNFYSSVPLISTLSEHGVGVCCTTLTTRKGFPAVLKDKSWASHAKRGDMRWVREGRMLFLQWMDTRLVSMCSTMHTGAQHGMVKRNLKDPAGNYRPIMVKKPQAIIDYNKQMGGVDLSDQLIQPYNTLLKCHRWWKTLMFHLIDLAVVNSHILFKEWVKLHPEDKRLKRPAGYAQLDFREELVRQLAGIGEWETAPILNAPTPSSYAHATFHTEHLPRHSLTRHNCKVCYLVDGVQLRTNWYCKHPACNVPLCIHPERDCFERWHTTAFDAMRDYALSNCRHHPH